VHTLIWKFAGPLLFFPNFPHMYLISRRMFCIVLTILDPPILHAPGLTLRNSVMLFEIAHFAVSDHLSNRVVETRP
jgi:hypothetical protein